MTAYYGTAFDPGFSYRSRFGHAYVSMSRCTTCNRMSEPPYYNTISLLGLLVTDHFNRHVHEFKKIKEEYRRLELLSETYHPNPLYA